MRVLESPENWRWVHLLVALLLLAPSRAFADDDAEIRSWVEQLGATDPGVRDAASQKLLALPPEKAKVLGVLLASQSDPEAKARLKEIIRQLLKREADALLSKGNLDEALLKLAELEGAPEPAKFVADRVAHVKKQVEELVAASEGAEQSTVAERIVARNFGPWLFPTLLETMGKPYIDRKLPAKEVFQSLKSEGVPQLIRALRSPNRTLQSGACSTLHFMGIRRHPDLPAALRYVCEDADADPSAKGLARKMLDSIGNSAPQEKP